jgi:hypothetical protein
MMGDIDGCYVTKSFEASELADCCDKVLRASRSDFHGREQFLAKGYGIDAVAQRLLDLYTSL